LHLFASISGLLFFELLSSQVPPWLKILAFPRSLYWWKWQSSSGPSVVLGMLNSVAWISGPSVDLRWLSFSGPSADCDECILQVPLLIEVLSFSGPSADWSIVGSFSYCMLLLEGLKGIPSPSALLIDLSSSHKNCWKLNKVKQNLKMKFY